MKIAGVIAEYNPFHNGHKYQLDKIREETGADYIIVAMSGDFLQRGVPAMTDKYQRTQMALSEGADLVLELPSTYATASAELFARGGVNLLASTGVVDILCYGCETNQPDLMNELVSLLTEESPEYQERLRAHLAAGIPFPTARAKALSFLLSKKSHIAKISEKKSNCSGAAREITEKALNITGKALEKFLATPNNILALEYEKALALLPDSISRKLVSHPILRVGGGYHSRELFPNYANASTTAFASATAIRAALETCHSAEEINEKLAGSVPPSVLSMLCDAFDRQALLKEDDFSIALYTRLWSFRERGYESFVDCSRELSNKIQNHLNEFVSFTQFAELLKSREVTYTRVCRVLTHIMLGIIRKNLTAASPVPYLRVLGFRKSAAPLLSAIKKEASVPLITKVSDASRVLSDEAFAMLQQDIRCADLYRTIASVRCRQQLSNEFSHGLVIIP